MNTSVRYQHQRDENEHRKTIKRHFTEMRETIQNTRSSWVLLLATAIDIVFLFGEPQTNRKQCTRIILKLGNRPLRGIKKQQETRYRRHRFYRLSAAPCAPGDGSEEDTEFPVTSRRGNVAPEITSKPKKHARAKRTKSCRPATLTNKA